MLPPAVRFADVAAFAARCGLVETRRVPQVFPARPEPAAAAWSLPDDAPDGPVALRFAYHVNPDRRFVTSHGDLADDLARAARRSLGEVTAATVEAALATGSDEDAFTAAFLATGFDPTVAVPLLVAATQRRDDYVAEGCVRAMECVGSREVVPFLRALKYNAARSGALRFLAGDVAAALSSR